MDVDKTIKELSLNEKKVLLALKKLHGKGSPEDIFKNGQFSQDVEVSNAASWLQSKKLIMMDNHIKTVYSLGKEGKRFVEKGLPEKRALKLLSDRKGTITLKDLSAVLDSDEISVAIGWLKTNGWASIRKEKDTIIEMTDKGKKALCEVTDVEKLLRLLHEHPEQEIEKDSIKPLASRKNVIKEKELITSTITLTDHGKKVVETGFEIQEEISQITSAVIKNSEWKQKTIRPYDIHAFAPAIYGGKPHPLVKLISEIRQIFVEMGFQEIQGDYVESCFWNMDVLFIPQDHPAREMQDTFYCKVPAKLPIQEKQLLEEIARVHENGGTTGSTGWGYKFSKTEGERALLRTHTTVNTIRYLYNHPKPPCKVFSLERVFRKEDIDTTHLPEFYQIEGIIYEENANFRQLIGILKEFYRRMGFEKIRFRPGYFPYTEPSMEVEVFWNGKWMELGGSGIFRPEVTEPIGVKNPVLAWGLGLERIAMLRYGLSDIRSLYISDLDWLRKTPLI
ncbi:MAG: phenylalanine--tRNA ligase subunit alpha [Thermoplasmata archaeon]|nr:phenylalanine--tRNA ligase subunit alpha [Thermoplasmata archaeon]MBE3136727.1 phenylalanine--tRNA ligase subunit alpha [Thermoplasmata archaeon]MBE3140561.1 phenylalanine--tRNA ligase subunit alpha [Thermoplasmata archaeon]